MSIKKRNFLLKPFDFITIFTFFGIFFIFFSMIKTKTEKLVVEISTPSEVFYYNLNQDKQISVEGILGKTEIEIQDKSISITDSPCSNKTCVHQGHISKAGQWLCCAPNQVIVVIKNEGDVNQDSDAPDAVSF